MCVLLSIYQLDGEITRGSHVERMDSPRRQLSKRVQRAACSAKTDRAEKMRSVQLRENQTQRYRDHPSTRADRIQKERHNSYYRAK